MRSQAPRPSQRTAPTAKDSSRTSATAVSSPLRSPTVEALRAEVPRIDEMDVVSTTQGARLGWRSEGGNEGQEPSWKIGRELENELLRLFGQADQVDHALKVRARVRKARARGGGVPLVGVLVADRFCVVLYSRRSYSNQSMSSGWRGKFCYRG